MRKLLADALLFACSPYQYHKRWDAILRCLDLLKSVRLTPGGLRGGFAVWAYRVGRPVQDIMWSLKLRSQTTLESYLQETAALNCFAGLPFNARKNIMFVSEMFPYLPAAALWSSGFLRYLSALLYGWSTSLLTHGPVFCKCGIAAWCFIFYTCSMWSIETGYACASELESCCCSRAAMTSQTCRVGWIKNSAMQSAVVLSSIHLKMKHVYIYIYNPRSSFPQKTR